MPAIISSIVILVPLWHSMMLRNSIFGFMDKACDRCICPYILGLKRWTIVQVRAIPMVTEKWSQPSSRLSGAFRGKDRILITHPIRNVFQIIMPTDFWQKGNPPNHILPSKKWGSRTSEDSLSLSLSIYIYGLCVWQEHATLAQKTMKAHYWENHLTVAVGVALMSPAPATNAWKP